MSEKAMMKQLKQLKKFKDDHLFKNFYGKYDYPNYLNYDENYDEDYDENYDEDEENLLPLESYKKKMLEKMAYNNYYNYENYYRHQFNKDNYTKILEDILLNNEYYQRKGREVL